MMEMMMMMMMMTILVAEMRVVIQRARARTVKPATHTYLEASGGDAEREVQVRQRRDAVQKVVGTWHGSAVSAGL
jgi:hypothetical protein